MSEEEFLLKWNNHQTNFVDVFNELLVDESFVDVTLVCGGGETVPGHKVVLAACSPLLHRILRDNPCRHPLVILGDVPANDMRALVRFIYQGEVSVSQSELASFLRTADNLQIKGLAEERDHHHHHQHHRPDEKKRKDKDERSDGRPSAKRQRVADGPTSCTTQLRLEDVAPPPPTAPPTTASTTSTATITTTTTTTSPLQHPRPATHKSPNNSLTSSQASKGRGRHPVGEERVARGGSHHPHHLSNNSKHKHGSRVHNVPQKTPSPQKSEEGQWTKDKVSAKDEVTKEEEMFMQEEMTVKTEPLDYPGEMVWTEGHTSLTSADLQAHDQLATSPAGADGVPPAVVEFSEESHSEARLRSDLATDDAAINNNGGSKLQGKVVQGVVGGNLPCAPPSSPPPAPAEPAPHHHHQPKDPHHHHLPAAALPPPRGQLPPAPPPPHTTGFVIPSSVVISGLGPVASAPRQRGPTAPPAVRPPASSLPTTTTTTSTSGHNNNNNNSMHKCQQCPFITSNPYTFSRHLRIHLGTKEFRCRLCGFATSRKDSLIRHFRMKHLTGEMAVYHDLDSRDIEELALARGMAEGLQFFPPTKFLE